MSRHWVPWSLLGAWLVAVVFVVPAGGEEFSLSRCTATGSGSDSARPAPPGRLSRTPSRELACLKAEREYEFRRQAKEAAERERQRRADEEATRRQTEAAAKETADQAAKEKSRARQDAERAERARKADETEAARQPGTPQEAKRVRRAPPKQPGAEQFMPGACATPDLTAKCAMPQDPVLEQIRKSQENAARARPSR